MSRRLGDAAVRAPRMFMSWEDWLTLCAVVICFVTLAISIQQAQWVARMPPLVPTALGGLLVGLFAARIRFPSIAIHPVALAIGVFVVIMAAQQYAEGVTLSERLADFRIRMNEWWAVVRANDISNDNLPFVTLVHGITFMVAYLACWALFKWHNAWLAIVPAGVVLLANISFLRGQPSAAFIVFLFGAIVLIARMHLQKNQSRWKKQRVEYPEFVSLNSLQVTIWIALTLIVLAWMVPLGTQASAVEGVFDTVVRPATNKSEGLARLFHNVDSRKGARLHTFGGVLPIQGSVKLGTKPVLEVQSGEAGLIRATSYDEYTGNGWKSTDRQTTRVDATELAADSEANTSYLKRVVTVLKVKIINAESTILTLGTPLTTTLNSLVDTPDGFKGDIERIRSRIGLGKDDQYNSFGSVSRATQEELTAAGVDYPAWVTERYLQLPKSLPARVREESQRLTAGAASRKAIEDAGISPDEKSQRPTAAAASPYDAAIAIQTYLREFPYDLSVESAPPGRDSVDFLLFDLKRGYFDYQSTAMAVMLRTLGIPSRIAVGYTLDANEAVETTYTVQKDDAYSWVEVFFPRYGWIIFNPTQDKPAGGAGGLGAGDGSGDPLSGLEQFEETLGSGGLGIEPNELSDALAEPPTIGQGPLVPMWAWYVLAAILGVVALVYVTGRVAWNWGLGDLEGRVRLWAKAQRAASWAGLDSAREETPREWSNRLGSAIDREYEARTLASAYEEARYGRPDSSKLDEADVTGAYRQLRKTLFRMILRRQKPGQEAKPK